MTRDLYIIYLSGPFLLHLLVDDDDDDGLVLVHVLSCKGRPLPMKALAFSCYHD